MVTNVCSKYCFIMVTLLPLFACTHIRTLTRTHAHTHAWTHGRAVRPWVTGSSRSGWGGDFTLDYNFQANFWGAASSNMPGLIMPFVDTMLRLLPLGEARAAAPDWHEARGFFGAAGQHSQGMQCGISPTGWAGPLGQCPATAELGGYAGLNFPGHMGSAIALWHTHTQSLTSSLYLSLLISVALCLYLCLCLCLYPCPCPSPPTPIVSLPHLLNIAC